MVDNYVRMSECICANDIDGGETSECKRCNYVLHKECANRLNPTKCPMCRYDELTNIENKPSNVSYNYTEVHDFEEAYGTFASDGTFSYEWSPLHETTTSIPPINPWILADELRDVLYHSAPVTYYSVPFRPKIEPVGAPNISSVNACSRERTVVSKKETSRRKDAARLQTERRPKNTSFRRQNCSRRR